MALHAEVPARFDVGLNGRPYMVDWAMADRLAGPVSLKVNRAQQDTGGKAGESSLARENLWRRVITSWHHGCGQQTYDDETADPYRFRKSRSMDVWTPGRVKPLGGLVRKPVPSGNSGHIADTRAPESMFVFGGLPYVTGNTGNKNVYSCWDTSTSMTSLTNSIESICTDGATVYLADGTGLFTSTLSGAAASSYGSWTSQGFYLVRWALGRLWAADTAGLWNITSTTARSLAGTPTVTGAAWTAVVQGTGGVLASVGSGTSGSIWFVGLLPDGSGIQVGYPIADLPVGEYVTTMHAYLGHIILGTNKGIRVCKHEGGSRLTIGPLLDLFSAEANAGVKAPTLAAVYCTSSFDRYVYFGWSFYDWTGQSSSDEESGTFYAGLGRLDLSTFLAPLQPAYATDVMRKIVNTDSHTTGLVTGCAVDVDGTPWFVVTNDELYGGSIAGTPNKSTYARLTSEDPYLYMGKTILGVDDLKVPSSFKLRASTDGGTGGGVTAKLVSENAASTTVFTTSPTAATTAASLTAVAPTESLETQLTWGSLLDSPATPQTVFDARIDAWPSPPRLERWQLPLLLRKTVTTKDSGTHTYDSLTTELDAVRSLCAPSGRAVVDFQFLGQNYSAVVDDYEFVPHGPEPVVGNEYQGTVVLTLSRAVA